MHQIKKIFLQLLLLATTTVMAQTLTVKDEKGEFSLDKIPQRIIALEYSYVDALAQLGISPVGVADDNDKNRILKEVRDKIKPWTSVGTRSQPSLEAIAALQPDLIIADISRHASAYDELQKIAPTLMLKSRHESYQENLDSLQKIAKIVGKEDMMKARIDKYQQFIADIAKKIPKGQKVAFATSRENQFNLYTANSYTGGLLKALEFNLPSFPNDDGSGLVSVGLEQLALEQPDLMIIAHYRDESIAKKWATEPLWQTIPAVKNKHVFNVNPDIWARARGITAAEFMAKEIINNMNL